MGEGEMGRQGDKEKWRDFMPTIFEGVILFCNFVLSVYSVNP
jgi:hypothetical protein